MFGAVERRAADLVLEGGAIETDGEGTLLATRHSIVGASRNPGLTQQEVERRLTELLGLERLLWLEHGAISGDDTDGHIDTLARFADRETILHTTAPTGDADHEALCVMIDELRALRTSTGKPYRLQALPFPGVHRGPDGRRLPATYANFLLINDAVLLPTYGVAQDAEARDVLQSAFPRRAIIGIARSSTQRPTLSRIICSSSLSSEATSYRSNGFNLAIGPSVHAKRSPPRPPLSVFERALF